MRYININDVEEIQDQEQQTILTYDLDDIKGSIQTNIDDGKKTDMNAQIHYKSLLTAPQSQEM